jgi:hypothetical protein
MSLIYKNLPMRYGFGMDLARFESMSAGQVYRILKSEGVEMVSALGYLRRLFGYTIGQAKEVILIEDGVAVSLDAHQERLLDALKEVFPKGDNE